MQRGKGKRQVIKTRPVPKGAPESFKVQAINLARLLSRPLPSDTKEQSGSQQQPSVTTTKVGTTQFIVGDTKTQEGAIRYITILNTMLSLRPDWSFAGNRVDFLQCLNGCVMTLRRAKTYDKAWEANELALRCFQENHAEFKPDANNMMPIEIANLYSHRMRLMLARKQLSDANIQNFYDACFTPLQDFPAQLLVAINEAVLTLLQNQRTDAALVLNTKIYHYLIRLMLTDKESFDNLSIQKMALCVFCDRARLFLKLKQEEALKQFLDVLPLHIRQELEKMVAEIGEKVELKDENSVDRVSAMLDQATAAMSEINAILHSDRVSTRETKQESNSPEETKRESNSGGVTLPENKDESEAVFDRVHVQLDKLAKTWDPVLFQCTLADMAKLFQPGSRFAASLSGPDSVAMDDNVIDSDTTKLLRCMQETLELDLEKQYLLFKISCNEALENALQSCKDDEIELACAHIKMVQLQVGGFIKHLQHFPGVEKRRNEFLQLRDELNFDLFKLHKLSLNLLFQSNAEFYGGKDVANRDDQKKSVKVLIAATQKKNPTPEKQKSTQFEDSETQLFSYSEVSRP